jgi:hypothetical protein
MARHRRSAPQELRERLNTKRRVVGNLEVGQKRASGKSSLVTPCRRLSGRTTVAAKAAISQLTFPTHQMGCPAYPTRLFGNSRVLLGSCNIYSPRSVAAQGCSIVRLTFQQWRRPKRGPEIARLRSERVPTVCLIPVSSEGIGRNILNGPRPRLPFVSD